MLELTLLLVLVTGAYALFDGVIWYWKHGHKVLAILFSLTYLAASLTIIIELINAHF